MLFEGHNAQEKTEALLASSPEILLGCWIFVQIRPREVGLGLEIVANVRGYQPYLSDKVSRVNEAVMTDKDKEEASKRG